MEKIKYDEVTLVKTYDEQKIVRQEAYYSNSGEYSYWELNRVGEPALIEYDRNGNVIKEEYYDYNDLHRSDGPAVIEYGYNKGHKVIIKEEYWYDGSYYRENGPAIIEYDINGDIIKKENYFYNGKEINDLQIEVLEASGEYDK